MKTISMIQLAFATTLLLGACGKKSDNAEGPMESAGEEADKAAADVSEKSDEASDAVEEAGDAVEDKTD